uniref:Putative ovule protein n=1 Tax=Solanum chacoense TaxID=4108 RepID=A0A0V0GPQ5_SOLCH
MEIAGVAESLTLAHVTLLVLRLFCRTFFCLWWRRKHIIEAATVLPHLGLLIPILNNCLFGKIKGIIMKSRAAHEADPLRGTAKSKTSTTVMVMPCKWL